MFLIIILNIIIYYEFNKLLYLILYLIIILSNAEIIIKF